MAKKAFEKSGKDVESKRMKEGSKREEAFDLKQARGYKCGGKVKMASGGVARGTGIAVKGKRFTRNG